MSNSDLDEIMAQLEDLESQAADLRIMKKATMDTAKAKGYNPKHLNKILARRKKERQEVLEEDEAIRALESELGMDVLK